MPNPAANLTHIMIICSLLSKSFFISFLSSSKAWSSSIQPGPWATATDTLTSLIGQNWCPCTPCPVKHRGEIGFCSIIIKNSKTIAVLLLFKLNSLTSQQLSSILSGFQLQEHSRLYQYHVKQARAHKCYVIYLGESERDTNVCIRIRIYTYEYAGYTFLYI